MAEVVRSGFVEGHHYGSVCALAADGSLEWAVGDVESPVLPRSCNKPLQAVGMLRAGLELDGALLALASASHSGEPFHIAGVRDILAGAGLNESALQTPADYPLDDEAREAVIRAGGAKSSVAMNCSGKHAAMVATCVASGWDVKDYLDPEHPLQMSIAETFEMLTGAPVPGVAVDGCGAPLLPASLMGLARAFRTLSLAGSGPERRVAEAIRAFPTYVSGTRRDEADLLGAIPGAIAKAGAESCYVVGLPDGRTVALKIDDGAARARAVVMAAALGRLGVDREAGVDGKRLLGTGSAPLLGGGRIVGEVRAVL